MRVKTLVIVGGLAIVPLLGACGDSGSSEQQIMEQSIAEDGSVKGLRDMAEFFGNDMPSDRWNKTLSGVDTK